MSFLEAHDGVFDAEDLQIMGDAFDAACGVSVDSLVETAEIVAISEGPMASWKANAIQFAYAMPV